MDLIWLDIVPTEIADGFHGERSAFDFDLVALHDFLDRGSDVTHLRINSSFLHTISSVKIRNVTEADLYSSIRCVLDGCQEIVIHWVKSNGERAIYDPAIDMHTKIDL
jgi:hypothetical protein